MSSLPPFCPSVRADRRPASRRHCVRPVLEGLEPRLTPGFASPVGYNTPANNPGIAAADLNGDGVLDLAPSNYQGIAILMGNRDGTFKDAVNYGAAGGANQWVALADLNRDGRPEIVTCNDINGNVAVLKNHGDGTFQAPAVVPLAGAHGVAVADFNGDGLPDVAAGQTQTGGVAVFLGNGTVNLPAPVVTTTGDSTQNITVGDLNGDGRPDLASANFYADDLTIFLNTGGGSFTARSIPTGLNSQPPDVAIQDMNGDGVPDLVVALREGYVGILLGNGDGTFRDMDTFSTGRQTGRLAVADFDGDGNLDVACVGQRGGTTIDFSVLLGNGDGTLQPSQSFPCGFDPGCIVAGDFNGDGMPDVAESSLDGGVAVMMNTYTPPAPATHFQLSAPVGATAGSSFNLTVTALAADNSTATHYLGRVHFSSSDGLAGLPTDYTFTAADQGSHTFIVTLKTAGTQVVTAADVSISGNTTVSVSPAATSRLVVSGLPGTVTAGTAGNVTLTAEDAYGNVTTGYRGTVHFTSTDASAALPADYTFTAADNGTHTFSGGVTLKTAGARTLTTTDTANSTVNGNLAVAVNPAAAAHFVLGAPAGVFAGSAFGVTVTAQDPYGNTATGYRGTAHFTSSDGSATLPTDFPFGAGDNGVHTFSATLRSVGSQTVTVTDSADGSVTGAATVSVNLPATHFRVSAPARVTAGSPFTVTVTALDENNDPVGSYTGVVHFSAGSDPRAVLPGDYHFTAGDGGVHAFTVTLKTAGSQGLGVTDTAAASLTGSATVAVSPATVAALSFTQQPLTGLSGVAFSPAVTVRATDAYGNLVADGTVITLSGRGGAALSGATSAVTANGLAIFPNLTSNGEGAGFQLVASAGGVSVTSAPYIGVVPSRILPVIAPADIFGPHPNASADAAFVKGLYRTILGRDAGPSEVPYYLDLLENKHFTRATVVAGFWNSPENRTREVVNYYRSFLERGASQPEIDFWVNRLQTGADETEVVAGFLLSAEENAQPDDVFVRRLFTGVLGRPPVQSEVNFYLNLLHGGTTRAQLESSFVHSPEAAGVAIDSFYLAYLRRQEDPAGRQFYVNLIGAGTLSYASVAKTFLASDEFYGDGRAEIP